LSFRREKIALLLICSFAVGFRLVRLGAHSAIRSA
jgi:hypothetical protein